MKKGRTGMSHIIACFFFLNCSLHIECLLASILIQIQRKVQKKRWGMLSFLECSSEKDLWYKTNWPRDLPLTSKTWLVFYRGNYYPIQVSFTSRLFQVHTELIWLENQFILDNRSARYLHDFLVKNIKINIVVVHSPALFFIVPSYQKQGS